MKVLFFSDIHGSRSQLKKFEATLEKEQPDLLCVLGDLMYHGPRNPLPEGYDPAGVAKLLNTWKGKMLAVRGNCDSEVDQMLLEFSIMSDSAQLHVEGKLFFLTHGHLLNPDKLPSLPAGAVFVSGHTHIPVAEKQGELFLLNPGSLSLPKNGYPPSYARFEDDRLQVVELEGNVMLEVDL